jgi:hypothetical protein
MRGQGRLTAPKLDSVLRSIRTSIPHADGLTPYVAPQQPCNGIVVSTHEPSADRSGLPPFYSGSDSARVHEKNRG